MKDVAREADVALGTVSRIINGNTTVSPELRKHVQQVIANLGYRPNNTARTLRTNRTQAIGIVVTDLRQPIAGELVAAASEVARQHGYAPIVGDFLNDVKSERKLLQFMAERNVEGLLLTLSSDEDPELGDFLEAMNIPIVLWERDAQGRFPAVRSDHRAGVAAAGKMLRGKGRRNVLIVAGHEHTWTGREQVAGLREGLGDSAAITIVHTDRFSGQDLLLNLQGPSAYDAVIANIHDIPETVLAMLRSGRRCPDDLSIVSIGDGPLLEISSPAISAVRLRPDLVGATAARSLLQRLDRKTIRQTDVTELVVPEFIGRSSI